MTNTAFGAGPRFVVVAIALVQSPYIVSKVGLAAFGYWSIVLAVQAYAVLAGGGVPTVATRVIARGLATQDLDKAYSAVTTTFVYELGLAAAVILVGLFGPLAVPRATAVGLPHGWALTASLVAVSLALLMVSNALATVTRGYDRWGIDALVTTTGQIAGAVTTFALLASGGRLPALGAAACVMNGSMALGYAIAGRSLGGLRFRGARFDRRQLKEMMTQGRSLQIVGLVGATNAQADRFMLLPFTSLTWIGAYALGSRVVYAIRAFPLAAFGPLMVRAADVDASGGRAAVKALYLRTLTVIMRYAVTLLIVMYAATYAATLAWLGARFTISAGVAVILGVGFALNIATGPGTAIAIACGRAELDRDYNLVGLGLNLILSVILGLTFGAWGVVVATTLGLALSSAWLLRAVDRWLQSDVLRVVLVSKESFALFVGATIISFSGLDVARMAAPASRAANLLIAACTALSGFVLLATVKRDYVKQAIGLRLRRFTRAGSGAQ